MSGSCRKRTGSAAKGPTRPHAHGAIEIRPLPLDLVFDAKARRHLARVGRSHGVDVAETEAGRWAVRRALKSAAGLEGYRKKVSSSSLHQMRNVWMTMKCRVHQTVIQLCVTVKSLAQ